MFRRLALALLFVLLGCAHVPSREPEVRDFRIEGAKVLRPKEIRARLVTRDRFDEVTWQADLQRIVRVYQQAGYYDAQVVSHAAKRNEDGSVSLFVRVSEGAPVKLASVDIQGLDALPAEVKQAVMKDFPLKVGQIFTQQAWSGLPWRMQMTLEDLGYAEARVTGEVRVLAAAHVAKAFLAISAGEVYRFGRIEVVTRPAPKVGFEPIITAAELAASRGQRYSRAALDEVQRRVFQLGVFDSVQVAPGTPDRANGTISVLVDVRELPLHEARVGAGLGIEPAQNEVHAFGEYLDQNWLGGLRKLRVSLMGGWAFVPNLPAVIADKASDAPMNGPIARLLLELEQPQLVFPDLRGYLTFEGRRDVLQAYEDWEGAAATGLIWQPSRALSMRGGFRVEAFRLESPTPLDPLQRRALFHCDDHCRVSMLEERLQWDHRDDPVDPRSGFVLGLDLREALGALGSASYFQAIPDASGYLSLGTSWTLAGHLRYGAAAHPSGEAVPIPERFYLGGPGQMRGFSYHRLSPLAVIPNGGAGPGETSGITVPIGGDGLFEAGLELRKRLTEKLTLAAFVDTGAVTVGRLDFTELGDSLQWAFGVGARYRTPLGPLRVDLAWRPPVGSALPISQLPGLSLTYPRGTGCFGIGGSARSGGGAPEGQCALHLAIGEAF